MNIFSGGYLFIQGKQLSDWPDAPLLPDTIWTPTPCICDLYPPFWAIPWIKPKQTEIDETIRQLNLDPNDVFTLRAWIENQLELGNVGFPQIILSFEEAIEFGRNFVPSDPRFKLIGIGLPESYVIEFLSEERPLSGHAAPGIYRSIESGQLIKNGGLPLGYEPLGYDYGDFHSFICNALGSEYTNKLNLEINEYGRFTELKDCILAVEYTRLDTTGAEPALWQPWLITEYSWGDT